MNTAVVIPVAPNRRENLDLVLSALARQQEQPGAVIVVYDGPEAEETSYVNLGEKGLHGYWVHLSEKHQPGMDPPRNVGVRVAREFAPDIEAVWFLDSDVFPSSECFAEYRKAWQLGEPRILIGPYDWLKPGWREPSDDPRNPLAIIQPDYRWDLFTGHGPEEVFRGQLNVALANFSGNLIWPVDEFEKVGGFWSEITAGRCDDGELGLRAASFGIPMSVVPGARAWHLWHPINLEWVLATNARDVPMLNARHPWVEGEGLVVTTEDGARFEVNCKCGERINTLLIWEHAEVCEAWMQPQLSEATS